MKKRILNISIFLIEMILFVLVFIIKIPLECVFQRYFNIVCPACGMGRAFFSIMRFDFFSAINYNILSIPLFIFIVIFSIGIVIDIIKGTKVTLNATEQFLKKNFLVIIILIAISYGYNLTKTYII